MSDFNPDEYLGKGDIANLATTSQDKISPDAIQAQQFNPDDYLNQKGAANAEELQSKYGNPALAGLAGAARGLTLGGSDIALTQSGLVNPETLKGLEQANPISSFGGNVLGGAGLLAGTGGLGMAGLAGEAGTLGKLGVAAAEGGAFGAGGAASEYAMGDHDLNAQKILTHVGLGAATGLGLGALAKGIEAAVPFASQKVRNLAKAMKSEIGEIPVTGANPEGETIADAPQVKGVKPTSISDIQEKVNAAKFQGNALDLPQKAVLDDAISRVEMEHPVHPLQADSLTDQKSRDAYNVAKEMQNPQGQALSQYEGLQKRELNFKTDKTLEDLAPEKVITPDATQGGNQAIKYFTDQYENEKNSLKPIFNELKKIPLQEPEQAVSDAILRMTDKVPGVAKMFDASGDELKTLPYKTSWGIDKATYNAVKEVVESLKDNPSDFESIQNIRRGMDQHVDVLAQGPAAQQIRSLKASLMDYMQDIAEKHLPDVEVRDAFKRYAINEQERNVIEKAFGASVGSQEFGAISKIKPEDIGDRIFKNTATVDAAKRILPKEEFDHLLANWIAEAKAKITDKGAFSSNKFGTFLKSNRDTLNKAFEDNPETLLRLNDLTNIMRILPDSPSINPSGTAKTLIGMLKNVHGSGDLLAMAMNLAKTHTIDKIQDQLALSALNDQLAGKAARVGVIDHLKDIVSKVTDKIESGAKSVFTSNVSKSAVLTAPQSLEGYDNKVKNIQALASNPEKLMDHLANNSDTMYEHAPNITQSMHSGIVNGVQFLNMKIPKPSSEFALNGKWEPTNSQKSDFTKYYNAVNNPLIAFKQIKDGTLSSQTMEAIQAVHPRLLDDMREKVMSNMHGSKIHNLNYATKISLSKFLGQPLEQGLQPQSVIGNQTAYQMPAQKQSNQIMGHPSKKGMENMGASNRMSTISNRMNKS